MSVSTLSHRPYGESLENNYHQDYNGREKYWVESRVMTSIQPELIIRFSSLAQMENSTNYEIHNQLTRYRWCRWEQVRGWFGSSRLCFDFGTCFDITFTLHCDSCGSYYSFFSACIRSSNLNTLNVSIHISISMNRTSDCHY